MWHLVKAEDDGLCATKHIRAVVRRFVVANKEQAERNKSLLAIWQPTEM